MFDISIIFFIINSLIVVLLFWLITFIGSFFFKKNENFVKFEFYECGFKSISDFNFKLNIGTFSTMIFVVLYDIELLFTLPFLLDQTIYSNFCMFNVIFLYICIFITIVIDLYFDIIKWDF